MLLIPHHLQPLWIAEAVRCHHFVELVCAVREAVKQDAATSSHLDVQLPADNADKDVVEAEVLRVGHRGGDPTCRLHWHEERASGGEWWPEPEGILVERDVPLAVPQSEGHRVAPHVAEDGVGGSVERLPTQPRHHVDRRHVEVIVEESDELRPFAVGGCPLEAGAQLQRVVVVVVDEVALDDVTVFVGLGPDACLQCAVGRRHAQHEDAPHRHRRRCVLVTPRPPDHVAACLVSDRRLDDEQHQNAVEVTVVVGPAPSLTVQDVGVVEAVDWLDAGRLPALQPVDQCLHVDLEGVGEGGEGGGECVLHHVVSPTGVHRDQEDSSCHPVDPTRATQWRTQRRQHRQHGSLHH